eukprot:TRINITY_DN81151_c0_g1_i1.p1 TRINITY_DN81151_c0_g1~~TRINITY_DN81151_c0_g1_i1.p1  ORF type:complete len:213 (+),score=26.23 TRINITY_DN81151_c0_g1_i1:126-764(+)
MSLLRAARSFQRCRQRGAASWRQGGLAACRGQQEASPWLGSGASPSRCMSSRSSRDEADEAALVRKRYEDQVVAAVQRQRLVNSAGRVAVPFREVRHSTATSAEVMALFLRPTSPSIARLMVGVVLATGSVVGLHWLLHPMDPFCVLSLAAGAFAYVSVVGTSHSLLWFAAAAPITMVALLEMPGHAGYLRSLQAAETSSPRIRSRRHASGF